MWCPAVAMAFSRVLILARTACCLSSLRCFAMRFVGIVDGLACGGGGTRGGTQLVGELGVAFGNVGDYGAVKFGLRGFGQKVDGILGAEHAALGEHGFVNLVKARMLGIRSANGGVATAQEGEHAGHAAQVLREVLAREGALVVANAFFAQELDDGGAAAL